MWPGQTMPHTSTNHQPLHWWGCATPCRDGSCTHCVWSWPSPSHLRTPGPRCWCTKFELLLPLWAWAGQMLKEMFGKGMKFQAINDGFIYWFKLKAKHTWRDHYWKFEQKQTQIKGPLLEIWCSNISWRGLQIDSKWNRNMQVKGTRLESWTNKT